MPRSVANVRASLETVLATKQPHEMAPQHYDVPDRAQPVVAYCALLPREVLDIPRHGWVNLTRPSNSIATG